MLALARLRGDPIQDYLTRNTRAADHPAHLRRNVRPGARRDRPGHRRCSAPVFAIPLYNAALGYARLCDPAGLPEKRAAACRRITHAMAAYPEMIAGPQRFDTGLMAACGGRVWYVNRAPRASSPWVSCPGRWPPAAGGWRGHQDRRRRPARPDPPQVDDPNETGDAGGRARPIVALEILRRLGVLDAAQARELAHFDARPLSNWRGLRVGEIRPAFDWGQAPSQSQPA
jgi:L-asparaginase II